MGSYKNMYNIDIFIGKTKKETPQYATNLFLDGKIIYSFNYFPYIILHLSTWTYFFLKPTYSPAPKYNILSPNLFSTPHPAWLLLPEKKKKISKCER